MRKDKIMKKYKQHIRVVNMLLRALDMLKQKKLKQIQQSLKSFSDKCSDISKDSRIFQRAVGKCWYPSAERIQTRISRNITDFSHHMEQFKNSINTDNTKLPSPGDIFAELLQIEEEFDDIKFDLEAGTISAITESIVLEGIGLGAFEIRLFLNDIKNLISDSPYKIIALNPNSAGSESEVTHPHVSHEKLCEGDGTVTIRKAIEQGRLCDFFLIIVRILKTYNSGSPYVSLDDWEGISCHDCGYTVAGEDVYFCEDCDHDFCPSCSTYCQICDTTVCLGCSYECPNCKKLACKECTVLCAECGESYCKDCINDEYLCDGCQEQRKEDEDVELEEETTTEPKTVPAVQSDSVGQTRISA